VIVVTVATVLLVIVAIVAAYFVARASLAITAMRDDTASLRKQGKDVLKQAQKTERTAARINDKLYGTHRELDEMLKQPEVQRALRKEGRS
jgi:septal ring-binding cell division protein DamX